MLSKRFLTRREFVGTAACIPLANTLSPQLRSISKWMGPSDATSNTGHLNYHPNGMYVWDSWYFIHDEEIHVVHLQKKRPGSDRPDKDARALGHAVSKDFLTWIELPVALYPGPKGSVDDLDLFTGCTFGHAGTCYLYYTARKRSELGRVQRLCMASSKDTIHWKKHGGPIIVPDRRWYEEGDCRDLMVVQDPATGTFHGFFTARVRSSELTETAVVGHATSRDLILWKQGPPAFSPGAYGILEEPDIFYMAGRWWMICATGNFDGVRGAYHDPCITYGTVYGSADKVEGPYSQSDDTLFLGSTHFNGFSCRTVLWKGKRYVMYTQAERENHKDGAPSTLGCLSTPKEVAVVDGRLRPKYSSLIETRVDKTLIEPGTAPALEETPYEMSERRFGTLGRWQTLGTAVRAFSPRSWSVRKCSSGAEGFLWSANLQLVRGRAIGLVFRETLAVYLDFQEECMTFSDLPMLSRIESRRATLRHGRTYNLRILAKAEFIEAYLDDILLLNFVRYQPSSGRLGLYIEAGEGFFTRLQATSILV